MNSSSQPNYSRYSQPGGGYRPPYKGAAPSTGQYHRYRRTPRAPRNQDANPSE